MVYLDDILIYSCNEQDHIRHVTTVLKRLKVKRLSISKEKSKFSTDQVEFLGFIISKGGIHIDEGRIQVVKDFPLPSVKEVQPSLGFTNFFRRFIKNYSIISRPLVNLTKKNVRFVFDGAAEDSFHLMKQAFIAAAMLHHFNPNQGFIVQCDASDTALGMVLFQNQKNLKFQ